MGPKLRAVPLLGGELGSHLTQCGRGRGLPHAKFHLGPANRLSTIDNGPKSGGGLLCPLFWEAGSPSNTVWPGPRPTSTPSFIFIHQVIRLLSRKNVNKYLYLYPIVCPQYTNVTVRMGQDRHDRQTTARWDRGEPDYKRSPKNRLIFD